MRIAHNPETGEYLGLQNGQWQKLSIAQNDKGEKLYLSPEGWQPLDFGKVAKPDIPMPQIESSESNRALRDLGLGTRSVLEGVGAIPGMVYPLLNYGAEKLGAGANFFGTNPGSGIADFIGLPKAETDTEKFYSAIAEGGASVLPTLGAGAVMQGVGKLPTIAKAFTELPKTQILSGMAAGGAVEKTQQADAPIPVQMLAGLAAGATPFAGASLVNAGLASAKKSISLLDRLTDSGQERIAGDILTKFATQGSKRLVDTNGKILFPDIPDNSLEKTLRLLQQGNGEIVPGSVPTTAQLSQNGGLAVLEKAMNSTKRGAELNARWDAQKAARQEAITPVLNAARQRLEEQALGIPEDLRAAAPNRAYSSPRELGEIVLSEVKNAEKAAKIKAQERYDLVDPEKTSRFNGSELLESWMAKLDADDLEDLPPLARKEFERLYAFVEKQEPIPYERLHKALQRIGSAAFDAGNGANPDRNAARLAGIMKQDLEDFIYNFRGKEVDPMDVNLTAQAQHSIKQNATSLVENDPFTMSLMDLQKAGIRRTPDLEDRYGKDLIRDMNKVFPGLIRENGRVGYDQIGEYFSHLDPANGSFGKGANAYDFDNFAGRILAGDVRYRKAIDKVNEALSGQTKKDIADDLSNAHGLEAFDAQMLQEARAGWADMAKRYRNKPVAPLVEHGNYVGGANTNTSEIPGRFFTAGKGASENMQALSKMALGEENAPFARSFAAQEAMHEYSIQQALAESVRPDGTMDAQKMGKFLRRFAPAIEEMGDPSLRRLFVKAQASADLSARQQSAFAGIAKQNRVGEWELNHKNGKYPSLDGAGLFPDEMQALGAVQQDAARANSTIHQASVIGSPTAQLQKVLNDIKQYGYEAGKSGFLKNAFNKTIGHFTNFADENIENMLVDAVLEPSIAAKFLSNTNAMKGSMRSPLEKLGRWGSRQELDLNAIKQSLGKHTTALELSEGRNMLPVVNDQEDRKGALRQSLNALFPDEPERIMRDIESRLESSLFAPQQPRPIQDPLGDLLKRYGYAKA